jgi:hypothetical protein
LTPELLPEMEYADLDENGFELPAWGSRLPVEVDSLGWREPESPPEDVEIYFNETKIPAVPLGELARHHAARRAYRLDDPRGIKEASHLLSQLPGALASLFGFRFVLAGLALQDHGLSKSEVNDDLASRVNTQWIAQAEALRGVRPDSGLRSAGRIKNTFLRAPGKRNQPKQLKPAGERS